MAWIEKRQQTTFDRLEVPIQGLHFLDGDIFARFLLLKYGESETPFFDPHWLEQQKLPQIEFPSGLNLDVWETSSAEHGGIVHLFGEMDLPYFDSRDRAWKQANDIAEQVGYAAIRRGEHQLEVIGHDAGEHFLITYDDADRRMANVEYVRRAQREDQRQPLLDQASRERLPKLYANKQLGLNALAQVKFFTPDGSWTWYASEASAVLQDGTYRALTEIDPTDPSIQDVIFFGLVDGLELELGYFALSELEGAHGNLGLPIERDRYFEPTSLKALQEQHRNERDVQ